MHPTANIDNGLSSSKEEIYLGLSSDKEEIYHYEQIDITGDPFQISTDEKKGICNNSIPVVYAEPIFTKPMDQYVYVK